VLPPNDVSSNEWLRNINLIPFQKKTDSKKKKEKKKKHIATPPPFLSLSIRCPFKLCLTNSLGSTNSRTISVHVRPFSTSAQKILIFVLATTTKICTREKSNAH